MALGFSVCCFCTIWRPVFITVSTSSFTSLSNLYNFYPTKRHEIISCVDWLERKKEKRRKGRFLTRQPARWGWIFSGSTSLTSRMWSSALAPSRTLLQSSMRCSKLAGFWKSWYFVEISLSFLCREQFRRQTKSKIAEKIANVYPAKC